MSEIHKGLVAEDPKTKDFGWDAPYVTIDELAPIAFYPPDPEMKAVMEGVIGILHGVDAIWRDILRQERRKVAKGCKDKRADKYDLTGKHMGMLQVLERTQRPEGDTRYKSRRVWYRCKCDCGKEVTVASAYLRETLYPSCGCRPKKIHEQQRKIGRGMMATIRHDEQARKERQLALDTVKKYKNERVCSQCGKLFDCYAGDNWAYKMQRKNRQMIFCGYSCKRRFERENPARN